MRKAKNEVYSRPECVFNYCPHPEKCKADSECLCQQKIDWEFVEWSQRKENLATLKGFDSKNNEYEATGVMSVGEIVEIFDIEVKTGC